MNPDNHGWDDDEETIINFTPKPRVPQSGPTDAPTMSYQQDVAGVALASAERPGLVLYNGHVIGIAPTDVVTPPPSDPPLPGFSVSPRPANSLLGLPMEDQSSGTAHVPFLGIDPPTVMDVPIKARQILDAMHPTVRHSTQDAENADVVEVENPSAAIDHASMAPMIDLAPSRDPAIGQALNAQIEAPPAWSATEQEWAAPCEEAVSANGPAPPAIPPLPDDVVVSALTAIEDPESLRQASNGIADTPPEFAIERDVAVVAPMSVSAEMLHEMRPEDEMERTDLHLPARPREAVADIAWLVILSSPTAHIHQMYRLDAIRMEIGRAFDTPIFVDDKTVSSRHAAIRYERVNDRFEFVLYDLASTNGTYVNGGAAHTTVLQDEDRIRIGETDLVFKKVGDAPNRPH